MAAILKSKMAADKRKSQPGKQPIRIPEIRRNILIPLASFYPKCLAEPWLSLWKGCKRCIGAKSAFSAVYIVNVMASKCSVSRGDSISM